MPRWVHAALHALPQLHRSVTRPCVLQLKAQFPEIMKSKTLAPPPKYSLRVGNNKDLLDKRRDELERWMWRLIAKPEIARSSIIKTFLDFDKALLRAQQHRHVPPCRACIVPFMLMAAHASRHGAN
jgi:hypothetical protein